MKIIRKKTQKELYGLFIDVYILLVTGAFGDDYECKNRGITKLANLAVKLFGNESLNIPEYAEQRMKEMGLKNED